MRGCTTNPGCGDCVICRAEQRNAEWQEEILMDLVSSLKRRGKPEERAQAVAERALRMMAHKQLRWD